MDIEQKFSIFFLFIIGLFWIWVIFDFFLYLDYIINFPDLWLLSEHITEVDGIRYVSINYLIPISLVLDSEIFNLFFLMKIMQIAVVSITTSYILHRIKKRRNKKIEK